MRNLRTNGSGRRTWNTVEPKIYYPPKKIFDIISRNQWAYKTNIVYYQLRDLALACLLYLTSGRINEVLLLQKNQFWEDEVDEDFLVCHSFWVSKRKEGSTHPTPDIPLPRVGELSPFTKVVETYISMLGDDEKLFKFGTGRAWVIINHLTKNEEGIGLWNHWFRAQSLSFMVNKIRSTVAVSEMRGIENPATLKHYYTSTWREFKDELKV